MTSRLGSILLTAAVAIACLAAAGVSFVMVAAPVDFAREEIVAQVKARTGRTLALAGPTSFSLFPTASLSLANVSLSAPPGMDAAPFVAMQKLVVEVRLLPLLRREVVIDRVTLDQPVFELIVDGAGRRSWDFAATELPPEMGRVRLAQAGQSTGRSDAPAAERDGLARTIPDAAAGGRMAGGALAGLDAVMPASTRIEGGTLRYWDQRTGTRQEARAITAEIGLKAQPSPLTAKGSFNWQGDVLQLVARLQSVQAMLDGRATRLSARVTGQSVEASYDGTLSHRGAVELEGNVSVKAASLRRLAQGLGMDGSSAQGAGPASVAGYMRTGGSRISLDSAVATLGGTTSSGSISVDTGGTRPHVKANLRISELDLSMYRDARGSSGLSPARAGAGPAQRPTGLPSAGAPPASAEPPPQTIEDLLRREGGQGPQVRGFLQRDGWSSAPLSLAGLNLADADARLVIDKLTYGEVRVTASHIVVALEAGALRLTIEDAQLYDGRAKGIVTLDGMQMARLGVNLQIDGASALGMFKDAAGFDGLAGKAGLSLALAGQGLSERELVGSLAGQASFRLVDGAIVGWNLPQIVRGIGQGRLAGFDRDINEKTDFSELIATFQIAAGTATSKDLRLVSPLLRATGAGTIELAARRIDYTLRPKLVVSLSGQATATDQPGFEIPIRIHGAWDNPSYTPDLEGILRDPNQVIDAVKQLGKQIDQHGGIGEIVRRALGGGKN